MSEKAQRAIEEWKREGNFIHFEGHEIFFKDSGDMSKPALLLLHGFPTSSYDWREIWPELTRSFRVICFDFIGFGLSDKPMLKRYSIMQQADIAEHLMHARGVAGYHLLAHDYGDTVAQELLARDLERASGLIQSCILLNGGLFPESHKPLAMQKLLLSPLGGYVARLASFRKFVGSFDKICVQSFSVEALRVHWELLIREQGRRVMPKLIRYMDERVRYRSRWVNALTHAKTPIRLINGTDDPISGKHMRERYEHLIPNADTVALAAVGHYPQNENPEGVLAAAMSFWAQQSVDYPVSA